MGDYVTGRCPKQLEIDKTCFVTFVGLHWHSSTQFLKFQNLEDELTQLSLNLAQLSLSLTP